MSLGHLAKSGQAKNTCKQGERLINCNDWQTWQRIYICKTGKPEQGNTEQHIKLITKTDQHEGKH